MRYDQWIDKVDELFLKKFGLTHSDFEDFLWLDAWADDETPKEAFERFCEEMGL